jgi:hypothetical protein
MTATNHAILKSDRRGRLRYSKEQKSALVEAYQTSGLSGPRFAALHGVNYQTLAGWVSVVRSAMRMGLLRPLRSSHIPRFYDRYAIRLRCVRTFPGWLSWPLAIWWA